MRILLTDGQQRKTLVAARSLAQKGIEVFSAEETRFNPTAFSKYCRQGLVSPSLHNNPQKYCEWLLDTIKKYSIDMLFPMDDLSLEAVMQNRTEFDKMCLLPLPSKESYLAAADKGISTRLAREAGLDCPLTFYPGNMKQLEQLADTLAFPLVIKPRKSSGSRGIRVVRNKEEFHRIYREIHHTYPWALIQEYIPTGTRYDVCLLYNRNHELRASFVQQEIRHFPLEMGPSTVQESVWYPELVEQAGSLMRKLQWYGVVEIEFMVDCRDGKLKFMEINPRFWNSLYTSILAGVDFPWLLYRLSLEADIEGVFNYQTGLKCRWLLPGDILHFLTNKNRLKMSPPFFTGKKQNVFDDIISKDDPFPALGFLLACLRYLPDRHMWKTVFGR